jgi:hypothetical protein
MTLRHRKILLYNLCPKLFEIPIQFGRRLDIVGVYFGGIFGAFRERIDKIEAGL